MTTVISDRRWKVQDQTNGATDVVHDHDSGMLVCMCPLWPEREFCPHVEQVMRDNLDVPLFNAGEWDSTLVPIYALVNMPHDPSYHFAAVVGFDHPDEHGFAACTVSMPLHNNEVLCLVSRYEGRIIVRDALLAKLRGLDRVQYACGSKYHDDRYRIPDHEHKALMVDVFFRYYAGRCARCVDVERALDGVDNPSPRQRKRDAVVARARLNQGEP